MTKSELIEMDDRFAMWLKEPDNGYEKWRNERFIAIFDTEDMKIFIRSANTVSELKKCIHQVVEVNLGWYSVITVFHLYGKRELKYSREVEVRLSP